MRRNIAVSTLSVAMIFASQPVAAQDTDPATGDARQPSPVEQLLEMMKGLPDPQPTFDTREPVVGFGFQIVDGDVRIAKVLEGSAASAAGLRVGMTIERINGARLSTFTLDEIAKLIAAIDGEITFTTREAGDVKLRKAPIEQQGS